MTVGTTVVNYVMEVPYILGIMWLITWTFIVVYLYEKLAGYLQRRFLKNTYNRIRLYNPDLSTTECLGKLADIIGVHIMALHGFGREIVKQERNGSDQG